MSLKNVTKPEKNIVELEIAVGAEEFEGAVERAYRKNIKKMNVQGFRKGKAPRKIVERIYGGEVFFEDAVNDTYPKAYDEALTEASVTPVDKAEIEVLDISKDGYTFKAKVTVKPEVQVNLYKGVKVEKVQAKVTDEDIENELSRIRQRYARLVTVTDRAAKEGDTAVIDYEGFVDGVPFEGGCDTGHNLKLGSGQFIPGFEEQIIGKNPGDEFDVNVTFPEDYHSEELKGKNAVFKVKLNEIKFSELPELDDEFAKDASEFDTLEEFKGSIKTRLFEDREKQYENQLEGDIIDAVIENMEADIPEVMTEKQLDNIVADHDRRIQSQGLNLDNYLSYLGMDMEAFRKMFHDQALRNVKTRLAFEKIAELEKIAVSDEEIDEEIKKMAENYKMDAEKIKSFIPLDELAMDLSVQKAFQLVKDNAEVTLVDKKTEKEDKPQEVAEKKKASVKRTTKKTVKKTDEESKAESKEE